MVSGLAPGNPALTEITGNSTWGSGATGRKLNARIPAMSKAAASSEVPIGRLMNGAEMFMLIAWHRSLVANCGLFYWVADLEARESSGQPIEPEINDRSCVKRQRLAYQKTAHDSDAERVPQLGSRAPPQGKRQTAQ